MYCDDLTQYKRRKSDVIKVGNVLIGGDSPIVVQTMTSTATSDIVGTVDQIIRSVDAGAKIVRVTVPSMKDIDNLKKIKTLLRSKGYQTPLVADIHFNQKLAFEAAKIVEKVRINPGNFADSKKFNQIEFTDEEYANELSRIKQEFIPLLTICKENNTALRIGTNHGSLSDRIMSRYGDTPEGMAESALEFLRICKEEDFKHVVISMKASNTLVMVQAMRLLVDKMNKEAMNYPLHLGVTEAGEGEDGRIKSSVGIGCLLADGLGDTIRVSLTEEPEFEIPVAQKLVDNLKYHEAHAPINGADKFIFDPYSFIRRETNPVKNIGGNNVPIVIASMASASNSKDLLPDYYLIDKPEEAVDASSNYIIKLNDDELISQEKANIYSLVDLSHDGLEAYAEICFVLVKSEEITAKSIAQIKNLSNKIIILTTDNINGFAEQRSVIMRFIEAGINLPVIIQRSYFEDNLESFQIKTSADIGGLFLDGLCDGLWLFNIGQVDEGEICKTAFSILQASRMRVSKPEYISCPSCGRTQFDIQSTTRKIRNRTAHLKGLKIGVMGCIVNGLGEMADADYGYIGGAPGKISLYHNKELIQRGIPEDQAVDKLIDLIKDNNDWVEPEL